MLRNELFLGGVAADVVACARWAAEQEVHLLKNNPLAPTTKTWAVGASGAKAVVQLVIRRYRSDQDA